MQQYLFGSDPMKTSLRKVVDAHAHLSERRDDALIRFARKNRLNYTLEELLSTMGSIRATSVLASAIVTPGLRRAMAS